MAGMFDSHGDVLVTKVHKPNSLEYLRPDRFGSRPRSAWSRAGSSRSGSRASSRPSRPQSAAPMSRMAPSVASTSVSNKSKTDQMIDGDIGPKMDGVLTYPYTRSQQLYLEDFRALVASSIDHPFMTTTGFNSASVPHDLLSGSNYDDDRMGGIHKKWCSEYRREFLKKSIIESRQAGSSGVRSELVQFLG